MGFPGRARGWSTQGLRAVTLPHRWYGGMAQESHEHTSLRPACGHGQGCGHRSPVGSQHCPVIRYISSPVCPSLSEKPLPLLPPLPPFPSVLLTPDLAANLTGDKAPSRDEKDPIPPSQSPSSLCPSVSTSSACPRSPPPGLAAALLALSLDPYRTCFATCSQR